VLNKNRRYSVFDILILMAKSSKKSPKSPSKSKNKTSWKVIAASLAAVVIGLSTISKTYLKQIKYFKTQFKVVNVIDGDSFILSTDQSIRLGNLEAPELENCMGNEAKQVLTKLILGKTVKLDIFAHDLYKRPIALVYVDDLLVNEVLLRKGLARYDGTPSKERDRLKSAYDKAKVEDIGIFKTCISVHPDKPNCLIKGNIDRHSKTKTYHLPNCQEYNQVIVEKDLGESWFCSNADARRAGYEKAKHCP